MTRPDIKAIRARLEAATPGPRTLVPDADDAAEFWVAFGDKGADSTLMNRADATFIANTPKDVAALLGEVERLMALADDRERALDHYAPPDWRERWPTIDINRRLKEAGVRQPSVALLAGGGEES